MNKLQFFPLNVYFEDFSNNACSCITLLMQLSQRLCQSINHQEKCIRFYFLEGQTGFSGFVQEAQKKKKTLLKLGNKFTNVSLNIKSYLGIFKMSFCQPPFKKDVCVYMYVCVCGCVVNGSWQSESPPSGTIFIFKNASGLHTGL